MCNYKDLEIDDSITDADLEAWTDMEEEREPPIHVCHECGACVSISFYDAHTGTCTLCLGTYDGK